MDYSSILSIEKEHFSDIHSKFDSFINILSKKEKTDTHILKSIIVLNQKMKELSNEFDELNYLLQISEKKKTKKMKKNIDNYEKNNQVIQDMLPYIIYYRTLLN